MFPPLPGWALIRWVTLERPNAVSRICADHGGPRCGITYAAEKHAAGGNAASISEWQDGDNLQKRFRVVQGSATRAKQQAVLVQFEGLDRFPPIPAARAFRGRHPSAAPRRCGLLRCQRAARQSQYHAGDEVRHRRQRHQFPQHEPAQLPGFRDRDQRHGRRGPSRRPSSPARRRAGRPAPSSAAGP